MMYVRSAAFMVMREDPRATDNWVGMKEDVGAKARADPQIAARIKARKDFMVDNSFKISENYATDMALDRFIHCRQTTTSIQRFHRITSVMQSW